MATVEEKLKELEQSVADGQAAVSAQVEVVEAQVEALFKLVQSGGQLTPEQEAQFEALRSTIESGFQKLTTGVEEIGVDSPDT